VYGVAGMNGPECVGDGVRWIGDPVDVVTGALVEAATEFTVAAPLPITWQRHYSTARVGTMGPLGWGQTHGYDRVLEAAVDGYLVVQPDGEALLFPYDALQRSQRGWRLREIHSERHLRSPDGTVHVFPEAKAGGVRPQRLVRGPEELRLAYDREGRLVEISRTSRSHVIAAQYVEGRISTLILVAHPLREPGRALTLMRYEYDARGDMVAACDRYGHRRTFVHDGAHRLVARTDRSGYRFLYEYDEVGRCVASRGHDGVQAVRLRYMPEMQATVVQHADGGEWLHRYDDSLSITEVIDPYGGRRRFEYDIDGRLVAETDAGGNRRTAIYYDAAEVVAAWVNEAGGVRQAEDPSGPPAHRVPRTAAALELGNLHEDVLRGAPVASVGIRPILSHGASIYCEMFPTRNPRVEAACRRDELGLLVAEERTDAQPRRWSYTPNGWVRNYIDHDGGRYEFEYSSWNHRVLVRDPLGREIRYEYTPSEKIAAVIDPAGNRHEYRYDLRDMLTEVRHGGALVESYAYDRAGNLVAKRDARGQMLVEYTYGPDNLKSLRRLADGEEQRYTYAPNGRFARVEYGGHTLEFGYSPAGQRCRDLRDGRGVEHVFAGSRLIQTRVLGIFVTRYRRLDENTVELVDPTGNRHAISLEQDGVVVRRLACGAREVTQFDSLGRCLGRHLFPVDTAEPVWRRRFEYSPEGDLVRVEDSERGPTTYRYDTAHQLTEVIASDGQGSGTYHYDAAGNLVQAPHLSSAEIAPGNKLVRANGGSLEYDHRNNVSRMQRGGRDLRLHRDALDRLRRIDGLERPWSADYDPLGRRTRKSFGAEYTEYFWDSDRVAAEVKNDGSVRVYVYADDFSLTPWLIVDYDSLDADPASGELHYLVTDQRGVVSAALDVDGRRVWRVSPTPYGPSADEGEFKVSHRLAGQLHDAETALCYHRFRYYSPELGRYLEEDPAGTGGGLNLYAYTSGPLVQFDPRGLECKNCKSKNKDEEDGSPVKQGDVDSYDNLNKRAVVGDGIDHDHIPAFSAVRDAINAQRAKDKLLPLTDKQESNLSKNLTTMAVDHDVHKDGRTYGNKGGKDRRAADAADLQQAAKDDLAAHRDNLGEKGMSEQEIDAASDAVHARNESIGLYDEKIPPELYED
jgi:RHS repeat-associated protein